MNKEKQGENKASKQPSTTTASENYGWRPTDSCEIDPAHDVAADPESNLTEQGVGTPHEEHPGAIDSEASNEESNRPSPADR